MRLSHCRWSSGHELIHNTTQIQVNTHKKMHKTYAKIYLVLCWAGRCCETVIYSSTPLYCTHKLCNGVRILRTDEEIRWELSHDASPRLAGRALAAETAWLIAAGGSLGDSCLLSCWVVTRICKATFHLPVILRRTCSPQFVSRQFASLLVRVFFLSRFPRVGCLAVKSFSSCLAAGQSESSTPAAIGHLRHIRSVLMPCNCIQAWLSCNDNIPLRK